MKIQLSKFGTLLTSRQAGREAFNAFQSNINDVKDSENVEVDFEGVSTFSPSWGDEFLTPLQERFQDRLTLRNTKNSSVVATLELLEKIQNISFNLE